MLVRRNVWELDGGGWSDTLLWYARAIKAVNARPMDDRTSWRFYAGIHGYDRRLWEFYGYQAPGDALPGRQDFDTFWDQCQHGSWYFLPWHRGYLLGLEKLIRATVVDLGGPGDWALPYWNYFKAGQNALPPAFATPDWPDGGQNPLFIEQRWGPDPGRPGTVYIPLDQVNLDAMAVDVFTGVASGGDPGFGGVDTGFEHSGSVHGDLESQPHDMVHVLVGGFKVFAGVGRAPGLMSTPPTAGLDPIFWLHHANIDRLWQSWRLEDSSHTDPTDPKWVKGPASVGERAFVMPLPDGSPWTYTPGEMTDLAALGYTYDDYVPGGAPAAAALATAGAVPGGGDTTAGARNTMGATGNGPGSVELIGACAQSVPVVGKEARTAVQLDAGMHSKVMSTLTAGFAPGARAEKVYLNLENVRGQGDATALQIYLKLPDGSERKVGNVGLFGLKQATDRGDEQAGRGLTFVLDITGVFHELAMAGAATGGSGAAAGAMDVRVEANAPVPEEEGLSIGRISIVRQGS